VEEGDNDGGAVPAVGLLRGHLLRRRGPPPRATADPALAAAQPAAGVRRARGQRRRALARGSRRFGYKCTWIPFQFNCYVLFSPLFLRLACVASTMENFMEIWLPLLSKSWRASDTVFSLIDHRLLTALFCSFLVCSFHD
jgi:hypothetical protein